MNMTEAVALLEPAFATQQQLPQIWADLGCGSGVFTAALAALLPPGSAVWAVDREPQRFGPPAAREVVVHFQQGDFEKEDWRYPEPDGILMANSFHFIANKTALIAKLENSFSARPVFVIVEYDTDTPNRWVPYPVSFQTLKKLFAGLGYRVIKKLHTQPSLFGGELYAALITR